jgi:hypothetical protein
VKHVKSKRQRSSESNPEVPVTSNHSGSYSPGPLDETDLPGAELSIVQHHTLDLALEEFPEGPYGATTNEKKLGKVSEWKEGQAFSGRFRDSNPVNSDRTVVLDEPRTPETSGGNSG